MTDLLIFESGNGGELVLRGNDLASVNGYENSTYLAMFSGNWWGNYLVPGNPFQSKTENVLNTTPLTSAGRQAIENAIKTDLKYLSNIPGTTIAVSTMIVNSNRLDIIVDINGQQFYYQWNPDTLFLTYKVG